jgi:ABC-type multidrug transport system fused ATPase/permease subunit
MEQGTHDDLLTKQDGAYRKLYDMQFTELASAE